VCDRQQNKINKLNYFTINTENLDGGIKNCRVNHSTGGYGASTLESLVLKSGKNCNEKWDSSNNVVINLPHGCCNGSNDNTINSTGPVNIVEAELDNDGRIGYPG